MSEFGGYSGSGRGRGGYYNPNYYNQTPDSHSFRGRRRGLDRGRDHGGAVGRGRGEFRPRGLFNRPVYNGPSDPNNPNSPNFEGGRSRQRGGGHRGAPNRGGFGNRTWHRDASAASRSSGYSATSFY